MSQPRFFYYNKLGLARGPLEANAFRELCYKGIVTEDTIIETEDGKQARAKFFPFLVKELERGVIFRKFDFLVQICSQNTEDIQKIQKRLDKLSQQITETRESMSTIKQHNTLNSKLHSVQRAIQETNQIQSKVISTVNAIVEVIEPHQEQVSQQKNTSFMGCLMEMPSFDFDF